MAPEIRSHYHKYSMAEENNEYRIVDYELSYVDELEYDDGVLVEECDVFKAHFSMFYSIDKFPEYFHYVILDEEFSQVSSLPDTLTIPLLSTNGRDLRALNYVMYDWNHNKYSCQDSNITTDDKGLLFKDMSYDWTKDDYIKFGDDGCIYAKKTNEDYQFDPLTKICSFITAVEAEIDGVKHYKVYRLASIGQQNTQWKELQLPLKKAFWTYSDWYNPTDTWAPFTDKFSFDDTQAKAIYESMANTNPAQASTDQTGQMVGSTLPTQSTVEWSIYSYDVDSEGKLRNFILDEFGTNYFRNKYTNNEPVNMCIAIPVNDQIQFKEPSSDNFYISSSKKTYILFDYCSNDSEQYPLYSPELLKEYGLAFIRSDWLFYDAEGNLKVSFYPQLASNLLYDDDGTQLKEYIHTKDNPLIGSVKSWKNIKGINTQSASKTEEGTTYYDYISGSRRFVNDFIKTTSFVNQSFRWYMDINQTLTNKRIGVEFNSAGVPIRICKPSWSTEITTKNTGTDVEKNNPQMVFVFQDGNTSGVTDNSDTIQNICAWVYKEEYGMECLCYFDDYRSYGESVYFSKTSVPFDSAAPADENKLRYYPAMSEPQSTLITYFDEDNQPVLKYERWRNIIQIIYAEDNPLIPIEVRDSVTNALMETVYKFNTDLNTRTTYNNQRRVYTKVSKYSPADENAEEALEEKKKEGTWMTPSEYYNSAVNTANVSTGTLGYNRASSSTDEIKNNWFWVDEIKNWCIWMRTNAAYLNLYIWNGKNGWDKLEDVMDTWFKNDLQSLKRIYYYNPEVFTVGPSNAAFGSLCSTVNGTQPAWMSENVWLSIVLKRDTNMSTYDTETFQNIHTASIKYNKQQGVTIPGNTTYGSGDRIGKLKQEYGAIVLPTVGCPCIIRNRSGQLNLMYKFKTDGNYTAADTSQTDLYFQDEGVTYLNSVCKIYFGDGDDKTIKDWKCFDLKDTTEETSGKILTGSEDSLYGAPPVVNSKAETINMKISITVPRPNISTKSIDNEDYILRWNR